MFGLACVLLLPVLLCEGREGGKGGGRAREEERVNFAAVGAWLRALLPLCKDCLRKECVCACGAGAGVWVLGILVLAWCEGGEEGSRSEECHR